MRKRGKKRTLFDSYRFTGFEPLRRVKGKFGDHTAYVISLQRRQKKRSVAVAVLFTEVGMTVKSAKRGISASPRRGRMLSSSSGAYCARSAAV